MSRDWLAYFKAKRGMGAVICEGQEIEAACAEIEALLASHNALVDEIAQRQETEDSLARWVHDLGVKYDALREAVAWERECEDFDPFRPVPSGPAASWLSRNSESWRTKQAARAEVDRLLEEK